MKNKIIATDLDRTLLPNGHHPVNKDAMKIFKNLLKERNFILVFVTGRNKELIERGIKKYSLPTPDFCVSSVGTVSYEIKNGKFFEIKEWQEFIKKHSKNFSCKKVRVLLKNLQIKEQPKKVNNPFKQSYFIKLDKNNESTLGKIKEILGKEMSDAEIVYSIDSKKNLGLVDVVPKFANKIHALKFLMKKLKVNSENILYAGDSGNDILPITSGLHSVLVKNASHDIKEAIQQIAKQKLIEKDVYIAKGSFEINGKVLNGNYVSGIIEGLNWIGWI